MQLPIRKQIRLDNYDYSLNGAYFITICTYKHKHIFGEITQNNEKPIVGADSISARIKSKPVGADSISARIKSKPVGADSISAKMVEETFIKTINQYQNVFCSKYVIMPNHFHAIIVIDREDMESAPTLSTIVQSFKRYSTIEYIKMVKKSILPPFDKHIWQRSYYDHIIRNEKEYEKIWEYIDQNPQTWQNDKYYT